jgi:hypothetical protein
MKQIVPILWKRNCANASQLGAYISFDDLVSRADINWWLADANSNQIDTGFVSITGSDYQTWSGDNDFPYDYLANVLQVTLS